MPRKLQDFKSKVIRKKVLPNLGANFSTSLLLFDQSLGEISGVKSWSEKFALSLPLMAGEDLKTLASLERVTEQMLAASDEVSIEQIVVLGGGSLGDFAGFLASIWKRGVPLIQIPSTWLAAMDSAHGGKTALNLGAYKNQMGTFWPAKEVYLIESLLLKQPAIRAEEAFGEAVKMALLAGGKLWNQIKIAQQPDSQLLWKILPEVIQAKYQVVLRDPFETKGLRQILNLGHTLGHVWEISHKVPHGEAVAAGLRVAVEISRKKKWMSGKDYREITESSAFQHLPTWAKIQHWNASTENLSDLLSKDKKRKANKVNYIGLSRVGKPVIKPFPIEGLAKLSFRVIHEK